MKINPIIDCQQLPRMLAAIFIFNELIVKKGNFKFFTPSKKDCLLLNNYHNFKCKLIKAMLKYSMLVEFLVNVECCSYIKIVLENWTVS